MNRDQLQVVRIAYPKQSFDAALSAAVNQQLLVHSVMAVNGTAAANNVGVGHSLPYSQLFVETSVGGDVTNSLVLGVPTTLIGTTNNDSFTVQAKEVFSFFTFEVSQASTGSPVYTYEYWNGSSFVTLPLINTPDLSTTGLKVLLFSPPVDWALDVEECYAVRVRATTAPSQAIQASSFKVCKLLAYREGVLPKGELLVNFDTRQLLLQQSEDIVGFFAYPSILNTMEASYQINP